MIAYRISKIHFARDVTGEGARLAGGRWNPVGIPVLYASESRALAALEYYVHIPAPRILPRRLAIVSYEVPESVTTETVSIADLPADWRSYPAPPALQDLGREWVRRGRSFILRVPSALMPEETNLIFNPAHPDMRLLTIKDVQDFVFDSRLAPPMK